MKDTYFYIVVVVLFATGLFMIWFRDDIIQNFKNEEIIIENINNTLDQTTVKSGQIWLSETDNPFEEDIYWYIIEIKADYVKFSTIKYDKTKEHWDLSSIHSGISDKISTFKRINKRVK